MRLEQLFLPIMRSERNKVRILFPEEKNKKKLTIELILPLRKVKFN